MSALAKLLSRLRSPSQNSSVPACSLLLLLPLSSPPPPPLCLRLHLHLRLSSLPPTPSSSSPLQLLSNWLEDDAIIITIYRNRRGFGVLECVAEVEMEEVGEVRNWWIIYRRGFHL